MKRAWLRLRQVSEQFWFIPACMTVAALLLAETGIVLEARHAIPGGLEFVYGGGETGARSVLATIAGSAIGVAGTVFSITIAALSYAASSMGPRLLDNFTRDRGNQTVLGTFIATFAFAIHSLRAVQGGAEAVFVPHYNVTAAMAMALCCIAALVYYLAHVTHGINTTNVVNLLCDDLQRALDRCATPRAGGAPAEAPPPESFWDGAQTLRAERAGYLQHVDVEALVERAAAAGATLRVVPRVGEYVFPHAVVVRAVPAMPDGVEQALSIGSVRLRDQDLEYAVRQMGEVAVRALSPGTNDPVTAIDVVDRFGAALCSLKGRNLPDGVHRDAADGRVRVVVKVTDFAGLTDAMFHMLRQYGKDAPAVVLRLLEVFAVVARCLDDPGHRAEIARHARLVEEDARASLTNSADLAELDRRLGRLHWVLAGEVGEAGD